MKPNIIAIPDVHGDYTALRDSLKAAEKKLRQECLVQTTPANLIFLGDLIDRGPQNLEVINHVVSLKERFKDRVNYICGNHEAMLFQFLYQPADSDDCPIALSATCNFIRNGGLPTLTSLMDIDDCPFFPEFYYRAFQRFSSEKAYNLVVDNMDSFLQLRNFLAKDKLIRQFFTFMDPAVIIDDTLFVHGGLTNEFISNNYRQNHWFEELRLNFAQAVFSGFNNCFESFAKFNNASSHRAGSGVSGPFWTDRRDFLEMDEQSTVKLVESMSVYGINKMVLGHSIVPKVTTESLQTTLGDLDLVFLDTGISDVYRKPYDKQALVVTEGISYVLDSCGQWQVLN